MSRRYHCEGCVGCILHVDEEEDDYEDLCLGQEFKVEEYCPCTVCIVKVMCQEGCKERIEFGRRVRKDEVLYKPLQ